jgi:hypothetical protein
MGDGTNNGANGAADGSGGASGGNAGVFDAGYTNGNSGAGSGPGAGAGAAGTGAQASGAAASGGKGDSGSGSGNGGANASAPASITFPENWKDALDPAIRDLPFMKNVPDVQTLAKNYANAQGMIGADKVALPKPGAGPEEWRSFYEKVGVPAKVEDYKFDVENKEVDANALKAFSEAAHSAGLLPHQASAIANWFDKTTQAQEKAYQEEFVAQQEKVFADFKAELGEEFNKVAGDAKRVFTTFPEETQKYFREIGMGKNPHFIRALAGLAEGLKEGTLSGGGNGSGAVSQEQALANITALNANMTHPYWNASDPGHAAARKEVAGWYKVAYPERKA